MLRRDCRVHPCRENLNELPQRQKYAFSAWVPTRRHRSSQAGLGSPPLKVGRRVDDHDVTTSKISTVQLQILSANLIKSPSRLTLQNRVSGTLRYTCYLEFEPDPPSQICTHANISGPITVDIAYADSSFSYPVKKIFNKYGILAILSVRVAKKLSCSRDDRKLDHFRAYGVNDSRPQNLGGGFTLVRCDKCYGV